MSNKYFTIADLYLLLAIDEKYKYVVRELSNELYVYEKRPEKGHFRWSWVPGGDYAHLKCIDKRMLRCVKCDDDNPTWIPPKKVIENAIAKRLFDALVMCDLFQHPNTTDDE